MKRITPLIASCWLAALSGCGTLSSIAGDAGKVDWIAVLQSAHTVYDSIIGPITRDCGVLGESDEVLNSVCTKIGEFDIAASQTLAFGDMAVAVGEDVSAQVTEAKKRVDALKAAYAAFLGVKAKSAQAATARTREVPAARSTNPYRAKFAAGEAGKL
jgi:hypothetical protein